MSKNPSSSAPSASAPSAVAPLSFPSSLAVPNTTHPVSGIEPLYIQQQYKVKWYSAEDYDKKGKNLNPIGTTIENSNLILVEPSVTLAQVARVSRKENSKNFPNAAITPSSSSTSLNTKKILFKIDDNPKFHKAEIKKITNRIEKFRGISDEIFALIGGLHSFISRSEEAQKYSNNEDYIDCVIAQILGISNEFNYEGSICYAPRSTMPFLGLISSDIGNSSELQKLALAISNIVNDKYKKFELHLPCILGVFYELGFGVNKNHNLAEQYYSSVSDDYPPAQVYYAFYLQNRSNLKDKEKAVEYYKKAILKNYPNSRVCLAQCYLSGIGVVKDAGRAAGIFRGLAIDGDHEGQYHWATLCQNGIGIEKNSEEAFKYYSLSAKQGNPYAQISLARYYYCDTAGNHISLKEAKKIYQSLLPYGSVLNIEESLKELKAAINASEEEANLLTDAMISELNLENKKKLKDKKKLEDKEELEEGILSPTSLLSPPSNFSLSISPPLILDEKERKILIESGIANFNLSLSTTAISLGDNQNNQPPANPDPKPKSVSNLASDKTKKNNQH